MSAWFLRWCGALLCVPACLPGPPFLPPKHRPFKQTWLPAESLCSMRPSNMMEQVSKPLGAAERGLG